MQLTMRAVLETTRRPATATTSCSTTTGALRAHWRPLIDRLRADEAPDAVRRVARAHAPAHRRERRHLQRLRRPAGRRPALGARSAAARAAGRRVAGDRGRRRAARAAAQRAARRLYGPQRLLAEGRDAAGAAVRPSELPLAVPRHPAAERHTGCTSTPPTWRARPTAAGGCSRDRTQAPSGAGYALENREIARACFPSRFRDLRRAPRARLLRRAARAHARADADAATRRRSP